MNNASTEILCHHIVHARGSMICDRILVRESAHKDWNRLERRWWRHFARSFEEDDSGRWIAKLGEEDNPKPRSDDTLSYSGHTTVEYSKEAQLGSASGELGGLRLIGSNLGEILPCHFPCLRKFVCKVVIS